MKRPNKRQIFRINFHRKIGDWLVWIVGFKKTHHFASQAEAVSFATTAARLTQGAGELAQVVLHGRDGRVRWERTYGADPKRSKG